MIEVSKHQIIHMHRFYNIDTERERELMHISDAMPWKSHILWLVVWNMIVFSYIGNVIIPIDELIFFRGGRYTTNQI